MIDANGTDQNQTKDRETAKIWSAPIAQTPASPEIAPIIQPRALEEQIGSEHADNASENNKQRTSQEGKMSTFERGVAIVGIGLGIVTAAFFYWQLVEMGSQTQILASQSEGANAGALMEEMNTRKQLDIVQQQAAAATKQAKAAGQSVAAIQRQAATAAMAFEASERPYIGVEKVEFSEDESAKIMHVVASLKNFGANTAEALEIYYTVTAQGQIMGIYNMPLGIVGGILLPGNVRRFPATINAVDFSALHSGFGGCTVKVSAFYKWSKQKYQYCEVWSYVNETTTFEPVDACIPSRPLTSRHP
jgi:hypothetical protein